MMPLRTPQQGFSLIEMMIASLVGLILMAGTMQMFSSTKQSSRTSTAITRMQENGRAGLFFLENAIRLSGYRANSLEDAFPDTSANFDFDGQVIKGIDNDAVGGNNILNGSDRVLIRFRGNSDTFINDCAGNTSPRPPLKEFEIAFQINDNGELVCDPDLYISDTTATPNNRYNEQTLIDGVEDMQIIYGVDTNNDFNADFYVPALDPFPSGEVVSVRVSLLLHSDDLIATQPQPYRFNGATVTDPGDRRLRKVFSSTTAVRNLVD